MKQQNGDSEMLPSEKARMQEVVRVGTEQHSTAAPLIARALQDDVRWQIALNDPFSRMRHDFCTQIASRMLRQLPEHTEVHMARDQSSFAIWQKHKEGEAVFSPIYDHQSPLVQDVESALSNARVSAEHWYLFMANSNLGVEHLIETLAPMHERCDEAEIPTIIQVVMAQDLKEAIKGVDYGDSGWVLEDNPQRHNPMIASPELLSALKDLGYSAAGDTGSVTLSDARQSSINMMCLQRG